MKNSVAFKDREIQTLQDRVRELEQQLAEAQGIIRGLSVPTREDVQVKDRRQTVEELSAIIQTLHDPVLVYDQNGVISMANASAIQAHGFDPTGRHRQDTTQILMVRYPNGERVDSEALPSARALKGETVIDEALLITNSGGQELSILVTSSPLMVNGMRAGAVSVWHDVTEQKEAEKAKDLALAQAEEGRLLLEALLEFIPEGICITGGPPDFPIRRVSRYGLALAGNPDASAVIGLRAGQHQHPLGLLRADGAGELAPEETALYRAGHFGEITLNKEMVVQTQAGAQVPILMVAAPIRDAQGQIIAAINSWRDFTAIKQLEEDLRTARDQALWLARFPDENPNPVARVSEAGIVLYRNPPAASLPGWTFVMDEPVPLPLRSLVQESLSQGQPREQELTLGTKIYSVSVIPILDEGYANLYGRDITEQKKAEKALRESEHRQTEIAGALELDQARLAAILQHLPVGIWIVDQQGRLIGNNPEADRIWAGEAPLLNSVADFQKYVSWHPASEEPLELEEYPIAVALRTGKPVEPMETNIRRFDGSEGTVLVSATPIKDNRGQLMGVVAVNVDITERKKVEEALRESEERFAKAFHASPSALVISQRQDERIETVNDTFVRFFGYAREEVLGKTSTELSMFVRPEDRQEAVRRLQRDQSVRDFELDVRLKSGEVRNVSLSIEAMNIGGENMALTMIQDVTLRKRAKNALRASEERYRAVIEHALDAIVVTDPSRGGKVLAVNPAACRLFGYSMKEFLGLDRQAVLDTSDPRLTSFLAQRHHRGQVTGQLTYKRKDGTRFPGELSSVFYRDSNGEQRAIAIIRDVTERRQAEEALRESEQRYRGLFEMMQEGLVVAEVVTDEDGNPVDYRYLDVNPATERQFGIPREAFVGRTQTEVLPEGDPEWIDIFGKVAQTGEPMSLERFGKTSKRWFECHVYSPRPGEVVNIVTDITDRKQFEIALRKRETILTQAGEMAHLGAWDIEFHNHDDINANPLTWSDEVYRIFGYAPGEVEPSNELFFERVHPDDRRLIQESVAQAIARRQPYIIEHRICRPDGEERIVREHAEVFFDEAGRPLRIVGAVQDITERQRAEKALRESEERFRSLADAMPQLVWTALPDGTVDYYNSRAQEYWGIKQVCTEVWEWAPVLHPDELEATVNAWRHAVETGETYQIEHRVRMANGTYCWHLSRGMPMLDEKGGVIRWFGTATNIHDLKLAEEQSKVYAERLERSNRELEQFAFMASHDLQEPLRKIEVFGDLLLESSKALSGRERNYLERMRAAAKRMGDMVEGLLQLSRVTTLGKPFIPVNLALVISDVLQDLDDQIRRTGGKVAVDELPAIEGDPRQLRQLMQNLIGNALKYHAPDVPPTVKVYAKQSSGKVQIFVEDQGIGFHQQDAERVFQPFQRLVGRSQYEGSGMGLAICRRIVERHGGTIAALSQLGSGATFIVTLPMYKASSARKETR